MREVVSRGSRVGSSRVVVGESKAVSRRALFSGDGWCMVIGINWC